jgi:hypothetical protein
MNPRSLPGNQGKTMASSKWSDAEIAKLKQLKAAGVADSKIAEELGRTYRSVTHAVRQYTAQVEVPEIDYRARADHWQSKAGELQRALDKANESRTAVDVLVEQIMELAPKAYAPPVDIYRAPRKSKSSPQSACGREAGANPRARRLQLQHFLAPVVAASAVDLFDHE